MSERASTKGRDDVLASASIRPELIERVESGSGEDAALSAEICIAVGYGGINSVGALNLRTDPDWEGDLLFEVQEEDENGTVVLADCCNPIPKLTTSLDAVVSLIEQKLPGWCWQTKRAIGCEAIVWQVCKDYDDEGCKTVGFHMSSAPRALLAACLRAILESRPEHADATPKNPLSEGRERS